MKKTIVSIFSLLLYNTVAYSQIDTVMVNEDKYVRIDVGTPIELYHISNPDDFFTEIKGHNLFIQALDDYAKESNLYIETKNQGYDFFVKYSKEIDKYMYSVSAVDPNVKNINGVQNVPKGLREVNPLNGKKDSYIKSRNVAFQSGIGFYIKGIFIEDENIYFLFQIENRSSIAYQIKEFRFEIVQDKELKSKSLTEENLVPEMIYDDINEIPARKNKYITIAFKKFTLSNRNLLVSVLEKNGERNLTLPIKNDLILNSKQIK